MQEIADRLNTMGKLQVYGFAAESVTPPAAVVGYPEIEFDATYGRGMDRWTLPVWVVIGKSSSLAARDQVSKYVSGGGITSFKEAIESGEYASLDTVRVASATPDQILVGTSEYLSYRFDLDIAGQGS